jgi:putative phosphoribosyl transferase
MAVLYALIGAVCGVCSATPDCLSASEPSRAVAMTPISLPLRNRTEAGRLLAQAVAERLPDTRGDDAVVLALPRGGVPVAAEIARLLGAPLDLLFVRKIGLPWQRELAYAAVVDGDPPSLVLNEELAADCPQDEAWLDAEMQSELAEIARRRRAYLGGRAPLAVDGRTAILVDDGLATGTTARAALQALRARAPARLVLAVPVAPADTLERLAPDVDALVCLAAPEPFHAIGLHYRDFHQLDDAEVRALLK